MMTSASSLQNPVNSSSLPVHQGRPCAGRIALNTKSLHTWLFLPKQDVPHEGCPVLFRVVNGLK